MPQTWRELFRKPLSSILELPPSRRALSRPPRERLMNRSHPAVAEWLPPKLLIPAAMEELPPLAKWRPSPSHQMAR